MKKQLIVAINIFSAIPILLYPFAFIAGVMSFDAPGSEYSIVAWAMFFFSTLYPIFIIIFIILSRKKDSLILASTALIPLIFLIYIFLFSGGLAQKSNYNTLNKDFICDSNSFISVEKNGSFDAINLLEKKNFYTYRKETVALIENNKIIMLSATSKEIKDLLLRCKNKKDKSVLDTYNSISN